MLVSAAIVTGLIIALYGVFAVRLVYQYKNKPLVSYMRIFSTSSSALVAVIGLYILRHILNDGADLPLYVSIVFCSSIIIGLCAFFYINRKMIG